jgi:hypothetical protein
MKIRGCIALAGLLLISNNLYADSRYSEFFQQTCARCHHSGPDAFRTSPDKIPDLLRSGSIRQHRFSLSEEELEKLMVYFSQQQ